MSFWINLEYGSAEGKHDLPQELLVTALPTEGMTISLQDPEGGVWGAPFDFEVEVEEVLLDATDPKQARYKAFVIPS